MTVRRMFAGPALLVAISAAGCGGDAPQKDGGPLDSGPNDADFAACAEYDAGRYMPGAVVTSRSGAFMATVVSVMTATTPPVQEPAVGLSTFNISIADASGGAPAGLGVTAEKPYMPKHMHGSSTFPVVTDGGNGTFVVSAIDFFQAGYWEMVLDLTTPAVDPDAGPTMPDKVVIPICVLN